MMGDWDPMEAIFIPNFSDSDDGGILGTPVCVLIRFPFASDLNLRRHRSSSDQA
jgi:hypothetical protein